jgi:transposase
LRAGEIRRLFTAEGRGVKELAIMFGVSQRTIQRALKRAKNE